MNSIKQLLLALLGVFASTSIVISGEMREQPIDPTFWNFYHYPILLIVSVIYLHWLLRASVMPLSDLPRARRSELREKIETRNSKPTIRLGYLVLVLYVVEFFAYTSDEHYVPNFALVAVFLIALGTLAEARALVHYLLQYQAHSEKMVSNKSEMPTA